MSEDEFLALKKQGKNSSNRNDQSQNYDHIDADVYDFATLRQELGVDEHDDFQDEEDDGLGDQLIEEGDDLNTRFLLYRQRFRFLWEYPTFFQRYFRGGSLLC